ncbi:MAG: bifunctional adenosylcobinamide kinase/adenosylcobinamide-phosphate guanylyltransferase [Pseudomonadota bacterium]
MPSSRIVVSSEPSPPLVLVLGGQRSGKSRWAEARTVAAGGSPVYIATAEAKDDEMAARIAAHRARRGGAWRVVEEPLELAAAIAAESAPRQPLLVDCLTLWLTNLLMAERAVAPAVEDLTSALETRRGAVVLVSNDVGSGVVPINPLARRFVDEAGLLHQRIAAAATEAVSMVAGLPLVLKGHSPNLQD